MVERDAHAGDLNRQQHDHRQHGDEHHREHGIERQRDEDAADGQDRRAHAQPLDAPEHLVDVVGVRRQAGDQRGLGRRVGLRGGEGHDPREEVMADGAGRVARDGAGHAVGDDVEGERAKRAQHHRQRAQRDAPPVARGRDVVDDIGEQPGQQQIKDRAGEFDDEAERHARVAGAQVMRQNLFHNRLPPDRRTRPDRIHSFPCITFHYSTMGQPVQKRRRISAKKLKDGGRYGTINAERREESP